jgi:hypothetical protein
LQELADLVQSGTALGVKMERLTEASKLQVGAAEGASRAEVFCSLRHLNCMWGQLLTANQQLSVEFCRLKTPCPYLLPAGWLRILAGRFPSL